MIWDWSKMKQMHGTPKIHSYSITTQSTIKLKTKMVMDYQNVKTLKYYTAADL
jgi:6-pyruvoyl-tetrahydropterin synthase